MPDEFRRVVFTNAEVLDAVLQQLKVSKWEIPSGQVSVKVVAGPPVDVCLEVQSLTETTSDDSMTAKRFEFPLGRKLVTSALILYCINRGIPPSQARAEDDRECRGPDCAQSLVLASFPAVLT